MTKKKKKIEFLKNEVLIPEKRTSIGMIFVRSAAEAIISAIIISFAIGFFFKIENIVEIVKYLQVEGNIVSFIKIITPVIFIILCTIKICSKIIQCKPIEKK